MTSQPSLPAIEPLPVKKARKPHPNLGSATARRISKILDERKNPASPKPVVKTGKLAVPHNLPPIHLSRKPITADYHPAAPRFGPIKKRQAELSANPRSRKKHKLVDDSAIESDGEGGDVESTPTTPASSPPLSPRHSRIDELKCYTCNVTASGPKQLDIHLNSKKHLKKARNVKTSCNQCNHLFTSLHNYRFHTCKNLIEKDSFYKL